MRVFSRFVDLSGLRAEFPVLAEQAYLNAGTDGPLPARAVRGGRCENSSVRPPRDGTLATTSSAAAN